MPLARRLAFSAAVVALAVHAVTLVWLGDKAPGPLVSDLIQFILGVAATWAAISAARRSGKYGCKVWGMAAAGFGVYTAGQGIVIYYDSVLRAPLFSPWISDQFLFFWVVPLALAVLVDRWSESEKLDWALALDCSQAVLVALALHLAVFALASEWQSQGRQLAFLEWRVRMVRDAIVLIALSSKIFLSSISKTRSLFLRLSSFFFAYTLADAIYLYAEAAWQNRAGSALDLLWSVPRVVLILAAVTWNDAPEEALIQKARRTRLQTLPLHLASVLGPLLVAMIALRISPSSPVLAVALVGASFACSSARFLITQDRQDSAAAALRNNRDLLQAVLEGTTETVYVRDPEGRYLFANRAARQALGCRENELAGSTNEKFFSAESARHIRESDAEVIRTGEPQTLEESVELNGKMRVFLSKKGPYRDAQANIRGVLGIAVDVTERRKMEEELRKAQRMESIGTLAGGVAHDFNNLLTVIKGYSQLLLEEMKGTHAHEGLKQIDTAAERAASLTRQLLAFSRQQVMQPRVISLNTIVKDMQKMLCRLIGEDIEFTVQLAENVHSILADPGQIEQVIMNLAANARDAMPRGGKLSLETVNVNLQKENPQDHDTPPGAYVLLTVADNGVGMDEKTKAHIFEPFFTTKPLGKGTGLGLSTVYGITKQSGGYIWAQSEVGKGATFKLYFPAVHQAAFSEALQDKNLAEKHGHETILVVEDDATLSRLVETSLKKRGYNVFVAGTAHDAKAIAQRHEGPIHLLLSDVVMPQTSGREIADQIRQLRPQTRVLWMSGYTDDTISHHGMLDEGVQFLQKPFTPATLADKVREVLDAS